VGVAAVGRREDTDEGNGPIANVADAAFASALFGDPSSRLLSTIAVVVVFAAVGRRLDADEGDKKR